MKKARLLLPVLLLLVSSMTAQVEHAPTPEQCRVDADAWGVPKWAVFAPNENEFANLSGAMMHDQTVSAKSLEARNAAFGQCEKTDNVQSSRPRLRHCGIGPHGGLHGTAQFNGTVLSGR